MEPSAPLPVKQEEPAPEGLGLATETQDPPALDVPNPDSPWHRFRHFQLGAAPGPREALGLLRALCRAWLRPEVRTKEQMLELLVLERFLSALPAGVRAWVCSRRPRSGDEAVALLEELWGPAASPDWSSVMRAPQDMTEGVGLSVGKEDSGAVPFDPEDSRTGTGQELVATKPNWVWRTGPRASHPDTAGSSSLITPAGPNQELCAPARNCQQQETPGPPGSPSRNPTAPHQPPRAPPGSPALSVVRLPRARSGPSERSHMPAPSAARPSGARSTCGATVARTLGRQGRRGATQPRASDRTPAATAARPSTGASTWCATAKRIRARAPSPVGSVARALGAASMCCATSASMAAQRVLRAPRQRAAAPSHPGHWGNRQPARPPCPFPGLRPVPYHSPPPPQAQGSSTVC